MGDETKENPQHSPLLNNNESDRDIALVSCNERLRDIVKEENQLTNNRMTWFLQFQGFLFLSVSGFATKIDPIFRLIIAGPGFFSGFSILNAMKAAEDSMIAMEEKNARNGSSDTHPLRGKAQAEWGPKWHQNPKIALVVLIMISWAAIVVYSLITIGVEVHTNGWLYLFIDKVQDEMGPYFNTTIKRFVNLATVKKMTMENATNRDFNIENIVIENATNGDINIETVAVENATNRDFNIEKLVMENSIENMDIENATKKIMSIFKVSLELLSTLNDAKAAIENEWEAGAT